MLLWDDADELPPFMDYEEQALVSTLGPEGLQAIDANLVGQARRHWLKVAGAVLYTLEAGAFPVKDWPKWKRSEYLRLTGAASSNLPRGRLMSDSPRDVAIKARLRALIAGGDMDCTEPEVTWAADGLGLRCLACFDRIQPPQVEMEVWTADGRLLVLHEACHRLWLEVCEER